MNSVEKFNYNTTFQYEHYIYIYISNKSQPKLKNTNLSVDLHSTLWTLKILPVQSRPSRNKTYTKTTKQKGTKRESLTRAICIVVVFLQRSNRKIANIQHSSISNRGHGFQIAKCGSSVAPLFDRTGPLSLYHHSKTCLLLPASCGMNTLSGIFQVFFELKAPSQMIWLLVFTQN